MSLLAASPFTAPFSVCQVQDITAHATIHRPRPSEQPDVDRTSLDGVVDANLPIAPMAAKIDESALATDPPAEATSVPTASTALAPCVPAPPAGGTSIFVLRV